MLPLASVDPVAAIIALAALLVSGATLYLTALRRADIEFDIVESASGPHLTGYSNTGGSRAQLPSIRSFEVCVFASNGGASSGVIEDLQLEHVRVEGAGPPLWEGLRIQWLSNGRLHGQGVEAPWGIEAGDADVVWIHGELSPERREPVDYARRLAGLDAIRVEVHWRYARTRGPFWTLLPARWRPPRRQTVSGISDLKLNMTAFKAAVIDFWDSQGDEIYEELARIARGEDHATTFPPGDSPN